MQIESRKRVSFVATYKRCLDLTSYSPFPCNKVDAASHFYAYVVLRMEEDMKVSEN
jgi:hypothetical protein